MSTLLITNNIVAGATSSADQLDTFYESVEEFFNTTKIDAEVIQPLSISTTLVADAAVTRVKREAVGQQISGAGSSVLPAAEADITNLSVSLTTTGRPVFVGLQWADGSSNSIVTVGSAGVLSTINLKFYRGSTHIAGYQFKSEDTVSELTLSLPSGLWVLDTPAAGTYTYKVAGWYSTAVAGSYVGSCKLVAYEL